MFGDKLIVLPNCGTDMMCQNTFNKKIIISLFKNLGIAQCEKGREKPQKLYWMENFFIESWIGPEKLKRQYHISTSTENKENQRDLACG